MVVHTVVFTIKLHIAFISTYGNIAAMDKQDVEKAVKLHFSNLGKKGGKKRAKLYSKAQLKAWGAKGGRPRKLDKQVKKSPTTLSPLQPNG